MRDCLPGLVLVFSATLIDATQAIVTDTYMAALSMAALAAIVAYVQGAVRKALVVAVVFIGLATGGKYPAAAMLLPLGWALAIRHGWRAVPIWVASAAGAFVVFLLTTPYAVLDLQTFLRDLGFVRQLPGAGHLGRLEGTGLGFHAMNLLREVGPLCLALLPLGLLRVVRRPLEQPAHVAVWLSLLVFGLPIFFARVEAARYLVAVVPFLVLAATVTGLEMVSRVTRQQGIARALLWVGFLLPPLASGLPAAVRAGDSTQVLARQWFEANVGPDALIVQEGYGAPLLSQIKAIEIRGSEVFRAASEPVRAAYEQRPWFRSVQLPLTTVGPGTLILQRPDGGDVTVQLAEHSADFNRVSYDPRLFAHADYIVTSSAVRNRFVDDPQRFAVMNDFYAILDSSAVVVQSIASTADVPGPDITIYRVGEATREAMSARGELDPLWWAETIDASGRAAVENAVVPEPLRTGGATRMADGRTAAWVLALQRMYGSLVRPFAHPMSLALVELERPEPALRFAAATLEVLPADIEACLIYTTASARLARWNAGLATLDRTITALGGTLPVLELERAQLLIGAGRLDDARQTLVDLAASLPADDPLRGQIDSLLEMVGRS